MYSQFLFLACLCLIDVLFVILKHFSILYFIGTDPNYLISLAISGVPQARSRPSSKMTKYVECWGADKPFANITDSKMAKNIGLAVRL